MNIDIERISRKIKNYLEPKNIIARIRSMPVMDKVYWTKVITAIIGGVVFGVSNFRNWPATLTMLAIYLIVSGLWALRMRNIELGIKTRAYFTSAMFQYFITFIAVWTLIQNLLYIPETNWVYP